MTRAVVGEEMGRPLRDAGAYSIQPTAQKRRSSRMSRASFSARVHHAAMLGEE